MITGAEDSGTARSALDDVCEWFHAPIRIIPEMATKPAAPYVAVMRRLRIVRKFWADNVAFVIVSPPTLGMAGIGMVSRCAERAMSSSLSVGADGETARGMNALPVAIVRS